MASSAAQGRSVTRRVGAVVELALSTVTCWAFGLTTCAVLLYLASGLWLYQITSATPLSILDAGASQKLWGLTYSGRGGAFIALGQAAGVLLALGLTLSGTARLRRLGLFAMLFWTGLWAGHAVYLVATAWNGPLSDLRLVAAAVGLLLIFGCAVHRTSCSWR
ncbi:MAG: hypothetical protein IT437_01510 [Phycisphaerales bacterium]|nr:hypothetical protein [Phycisphaerales bacterium]